MINPYRGVLINGLYYGYVSETYKESLLLKNSTYESQVNRTSVSLGRGKESFALSVSLDSNYVVRQGDLDLGTTTWVGVSRLAHLKSILGANGASLPIVFVNPYGATWNVIPSGTMDIIAFNPDNPGSSTGVEFRVNITLDSV